MQPNIKLIAFDTSAAHCAAALVLGDRIVTRVDEMAKGQAEHLMPMLEKMLRDENLDWSDLDGIGVGVGPGNFTGIRIAVSAARGLALGLSKPAIGVNGFEARAHELQLPLTITIAAPRGQLYVQDMRETERISAPLLIPARDALPTPLPFPIAAEKTASDLIKAMARIAASRLHEPNQRPTPLYIRSADAAPPRDPAPLLLP